MASIASKNRITFKRKRPNPLFQDWLEELHEEAKVKKSKLEPILREALVSLSKYPLPLKTGTECAILKGFERKLCLFLDQRLEVHQFNSGQDGSAESNGRAHPPKQSDNISSIGKQTTKPSPVSKTSTLSADSTIGVQNDCDSIETTKPPNSSRNNNSLNSKEKLTKKSQNKMYKPAYRSGGYAILLALFENLQDNPSNPALTKESLIEKAQKHSEESFVRPKPESFYTAWSNMSRLVTKGLVEKTRRKKVVYSLTEQGISVSRELLKEYANKPTANDIIFDNLSNPTSTVSQSSYDTESASSQIIGTQSSSSEDLNFFDMPAGSFEVILLIDKCETGGVSKKTDPTVAQFNKYPDLKHEYRSLKVGDYTWIARHKVNKEQELVLPYVVERKRMDDLGASIKDGRFHEQKFRLRKCGLDNVIYLVENYGSNIHVGLPIQSLMQALANTRVQDGFKIHMTNSLSNSARFLAMMTKRLTIEYKDKSLRGCNKEPINGELMTFQYLCKSSSKTKPLTVTETFIKLLLQLKGVSIEKALAVTNVYKTPVALFKAYENCNQKEGEMLLANLRYTNTSRNVGPIISKSIYHLFNIN